MSKLDHLSLEKLVEDVELGRLNLEMGSTSKKIKKINSPNENSSRIKKRRTSTSFACYHMFWTDEKIVKLVDVLMSLLVRLVYICQASFSIYIVATLMATPFYWTLVLAVLAIVVDGFIVVVRRKGKEYTWYIDQFKLD